MRHRTLEFGCNIEIVKVNSTYCTLVHILVAFIFDSIKGIYINIINIGSIHNDVDINGFI